MSTAGVEHTYGEGPHRSTLSESLEWNLHFIWRIACQPQRRGRGPFYAQHLDRGLDATLHRTLHMQSQMILGRINPVSLNVGTLMNPPLQQTRSLICFRDPGGEDTSRLAIDAQSLSGRRSAAAPSTRPGLQGWLAGSPRFAGSAPKKGPPPLRFIDRSLRMRSGLWTHQGCIREA